MTSSAASYYLSPSSSQQPLSPPIPFAKYASSNTSNNSINSNNNMNVSNSSLNQSAKIVMHLNNNNGASQSVKVSPSIKVKTNELFYKWLSSKERTEQLKEAIYFIKSTNKIPKLTDLESFKNVNQISISRKKIRPNLILFKLNF